MDHSRPFQQQQQQPPREVTAIPVMAVPMPSHGGVASSNVPVVALSAAEKREIREKIDVETANVLLLQEFLDESASQLTYHGLAQLHEAIRDGQLAVLFRNNHFSTIFKFQGKIHVLVTDQGYMHESRVVWERLCQVDGDTEFLSHDFTKPGSASNSNSHSQPRSHAVPEDSIPIAMPAPIQYQTAQTPHHHNNNHSHHNHNFKTTKRNRKSSVSAVPLTADEIQALQGTVPPEAPPPMQTQGDKCVIS
eukprot:c9314_g1_i1.p1 GENE.c9314_g1_i1~~c9314_g1_i1.p1  ORF type:complete len:256 (+),score=80.00 c9314_g1_i1:22-768(+)